eukprot:m.140721 g.140721  ORF g.140721 m.140721 type:complete len:479 (-) comp13185_c1_seq2:5581-7017(-)
MGSMKLEEVDIAIKKLTAAKGMLLARKSMVKKQCQQKTQQLESSQSPSDAQLKLLALMKSWIRRYAAMVKEVDDLRFKLVKLRQQNRHTLAAEGRTPLIRLAKGIAFMLALLVSAMSLMIVVVTPCLVVALVNRKAFHAIMARVSNVWFRFMCGMLEIVAGVDIDVHLHTSAHSSSDMSFFAAERALLLSNHVCHTDWYPLLCVLGRFDQLQQARIVMKDSLKKIPFFGWGLQAFLGIFLARGGGSDLPWIKRVLSYTQSIEQPTSLIMFPEGTVIEEKTIRKSHQFSEANGLQKLYHVIQPRTGGFTAIMDHRNLLDSVYDVTIDYEEFAVDERPSEASFVKWRLPPHISLYLRRYPIDDLPHTNDELIQWMRDRYIEKEELLKSIHKDHHHDTNESEHTHHSYTHVPNSTVNKLVNYLPSMLTLFLLNVLYFFYIVLTPIGFLYSASAIALWWAMGHFFMGFDGVLVNSFTKSKVD